MRNADSGKFINSIIFNDQNRLISPNQCVAYDLLCQQSKVKIGFIPLTDSIKSNTDQVSNKAFRSLIEFDEEVKRYTLPNYLGARIPIKP